MERVIAINVGVMAKQDALAVAEGKLPVHPAEEEAHFGSMTLVPNRTLPGDVLTAVGQEVSLVIHVAVVDKEIATDAGDREGAIPVAEDEQ